MLTDLTFRPLKRADSPAIMALQQVMLGALPDPSWYYPSPEETFAQCCDRGETYGYWDGNTLAGFAILTPGSVRGEKSYAHKVGDPSENTFDFQDIMVHPSYRRRGMHSAFLSLFEAMSRELGGVAMYCTIAPDNFPSVSSFEKAGYHCVCQKPAYDGRLRGYYKKDLV